jgi:tetraacyldisaccharide 4'-kinase
MRQRIENWLNQIWYGEKAAPGWLKILVPVYSKLFALDKKSKTKRQPEALKGRAILVVGNITVGGSGKTPLVIRLCRVFEQAGLRAAVASRGYGRKGGSLELVTAESAATEVGDEPIVIARRAGVPVMVAADRCQAASALFSQGADIVIADDGLQHHRLPRSCEICVVDAQREFGNRMLLPAGPLREPVERLGDFDYVVVNGYENHANGIEDVIRMQLVQGPLFSLSGTESWRLSQFAGCRVNAVAGIGNPQRFFKVLKNAGLKTVEYAYPDHHQYKQDNFSDMEPGLPIIMTEKDAVKCTHLKLENAWFLSVEASLPAALEKDLIRRMSEIVNAGKGG